MAKRYGRSIVLWLETDLGGNVLHYAWDIFSFNSWVLIDHRDIEKPSDLHLEVSLSFQLDKSRPIAVIQWSIHVSFPFVKESRSIG